MKKTILLLLLVMSLTSIAQETGKIGFRFAGGIANLYSKDYKFTPIFSYSVGVALLEKNKPFCVPIELNFETKGGIFNDAGIQRKFSFKNIGIYILPQYKFTKKCKHTVVGGIYLSNLNGPHFSPSFADTISTTHALVYYTEFKNYDLGLCAGYKYSLTNTKNFNFKFDLRLAYSLLYISKWSGFKNLALQTGLTILLNSKNK